MINNHDISRRKFLGTVTLAGAALQAGLNHTWADILPAAGKTVATDIPVIDSHIHLYDPFRPQGVPWPPKT